LALFSVQLGLALARLRIWSLFCSRLIGSQSKIVSGRQFGGRRQPGGAAASQFQLAQASVWPAQNLWGVRQPGDETLSQRELEALELVAAGSTNCEAAARLFISEATVKTHPLRIHAKRGLLSASET
jgi:DNA-binding CsgD family transcriptional regulator